MDRRKLYIGLGIAGGLGALFYLLRSRSSGTASPVVGGSSVANASPQYFVPLVQSPTPNPTATTPTSNVPVPVTAPSSPISAPKAPTTPSQITTPSNGVGTAAVIASNPYPVGTKVTSSETISQSMYDPLYNTWLDLTSKGGIYTSPGAAVSGSAYNPAWNGSGRLALTNGGASVAEYNPSGTLVGTYKIGS